MPKLSVIFASTRPARAGLPVATWFVEQAQKHGKFEVEFIDLQVQNLPLFDEPKHPRLGQYSGAHTKAWSAKIAPADAFVFVTPEYNHSAPPALLNALDYLFNEWACKPASFVSYGGVAGGTRAAQHAKAALLALRMVPLPEAVPIPFFTKLIDAQGKFNAPDELEKSAQGMLNELLRWAEALKPLRATPS